MQEPEICHPTERIQPDDGRDPLPPARSPGPAANLHLAGLRPPPALSQAEELSRLLDGEARGQAIQGDGRPQQAARTRRGCASSAPSSWCTDRFGGSRSERTFRRSIRQRRADPRASPRRRARRGHAGARASAAPPGARARAHTASGRGRAPARQIATDAAGPHATTSSTLVRKVSRCSRHLPGCLHLDGKERRILDLHVDLLGRRHEIGAPVLVLAQHTGEKLDQGRPPYRAVAIEPGAVAANLQTDIAAIGRMPALHRRRAPLRHRCNQILRACRNHPTVSAFVSSIFRFRRHIHSRRASV